MNLSVVLRACVIALIILATMPAYLYADTVDDLKQQIDVHNTQIESLNKEISQYQKQLDSVSNTKKTLQGTLSQLDISRKKVTANISVTKNKDGSYPSFTIPLHDLQLTKE